MAKQKDDLNIIDRLNAASSMQSAVLTAVEIFETSLDTLVQRIFRKDDHAVKYAVEPLLNASGPLGNLIVRLKLTFALGIISQDVFQDMDRLIKLRDQVNRDSREFSFTSLATLEAIKKWGWCSWKYQHRIRMLILIFILCIWQGKSKLSDRHLPWQLRVCAQS